MIFLLSKQTIFSVPDAQCAQSQPPTPAYILNRAPANLTHSTSEVEFSRIDPTLKASSSPQNPLRNRPRHLYDLRRREEHPLTKTLSDVVNGPRFFIDSQTKITKLRHAALVRGSIKSASKGFFGKGKGKKVGDWDLPKLRVVASDSEGKMKKERGNKGIDEVIFELFKKPEDRWEWRMDCGDGKLEEVATEEPYLAQDGTPEHRLVMARPLPRDVLDALVALWCCRVWAAAAEQHKESLPGTSMEDVRRRMRLGGGMGRGGGAVWMGGGAGGG
jgi:hypothetical protein